MASLPSPRVRESKKATWLILEAPQHGDRKDLYFGSVVSHGRQLRPWESYRPNWDDPALDDTMKVNGQDQVKRAVLHATVDRLWKANAMGEDATKNERDAPVEFTDLLQGRVAAKKAATQAKLLGLVNLYLHKRDEDTMIIESGSCKQYTLDNPAAKLQDNLWSCAPWREQMQKLVDLRDNQGQKRHLLVTGLWICEGLQVGWKMAHGYEIGAGVQITGAMLMAALGMPPNENLAKNFDSKVDFAHAKVEGEYIRATCKHRLIFAMQYNEMRVYFSKSSGYLWRTDNKTLQGVDLEGVAHGYGFKFNAGEDDENGKEIEPPKTDAEAEYNDSQVDWFYYAEGNDSDLAISLNDDAPHGDAIEN